MPFSASWLSSMPIPFIVGGHLFQNNAVLRWSSTRGCDFFENHPPNHHRLLWGWDRRRSPAEQSPDPPQHEVGGDVVERQNEREHDGFRRGHARVGAKAHQHHPRKEDEPAQAIEEGQEPYE